MTYRYLEANEPLAVGDLVQLWHLVHYDKGTFVVDGVTSSPDVWTATSVDGQNLCHLRWRRGRNKGTTLDIVRLIQPSKCWVKAHDDWMWAQAARRRVPQPVAPENTTE